MYVTYPPWATGQANRYRSPLRSARGHGKYFRGGPGTKASLTISFASVLAAWNGYPGPAGNAIVLIAPRLDTGGVIVQAHFFLDGTPPASSSAMDTNGASGIEGFNPGAPHGNASVGTNGVATTAAALAARFADWCNTQSGASWAFEYVSTAVGTVTIRQKQDGYFGNTMPYAISDEGVVALGPFTGGLDGVNAGQALPLSPAGGGPRLALFSSVPPDADFAPFTYD